jgi:hypothetical protein
MTDSDLTITIPRLDPAETLIHLTSPESVAARVLGPRCRFARTVEVAHWFRPLPDSPGTMRAIVSEPSLWDPESPFLYDVIVRPESGPELRRTLGLRTVTLGLDGFRIQRRPLKLVGVERTRLDDAAKLRQGGVNVVVCSVRPETASLWSDADTWGFFVVGELSADSMPLVPQLESHPSHLGWICDPAMTPPTGLVGVRAFGNPKPPAWARFVIGESPEQSIPSIPIVRTPA